MRMQINKISYFMVVCAITIVTGRRSARNDDDEQIKMQVVNHFPCKNSATWHEKIRFPNSSVSKMQADPDYPGCYKMGGNVQIMADVDPDLQFHLQLSHSTGERFETNECSKYDKETGCGGVGSCLYCDECDKFLAKKLERNRTEGLGFWITVDGKRADCTQAFNSAKSGNSVNTRRRPKTSTNSRVSARLAALGGLRNNNARQSKESGTYFHMCMPTKAQFLKAQGIAKDIWNELQEDKQSRASSAVPKKVGVFMVVRFFDKDVSAMAKLQYEFIEYYKRQNDGKSPPFANELAFNKMIANEQGFIGCHRIVANLYLD